MTDPGVTCKSTRYGAGCGHPITEHDGDPARECCCCNRKHNDPEHANDCVACHIRRIKGELGTERAQAHVIALHLPIHLRQPFWRDAIERYLSTEPVGPLPEGNTE